MTQQTFAFVLMPFDPALNDLYRLAIKDPLATINIRAERVDEQQFHEETILQRIYNQIEAADFVIADMTGRNPNVFYEVGYAHAKGKTCLLLTSTPSDIPFDLKHHRHIIYSKDAHAKLKDQLIAECQEVKRRLDDSHRHLIVETTVGYGFLNKDKWFAKGEIKLNFDITNSTGSTYQIDAAYFYTGPNWNFVQDGQDCASTKSDHPEFITRHFIRVPVHRIANSGWARATVSGVKELANTFKGEKLLDQYTVKGSAMLRLQTDRGTFDYRSVLDVTFDEIPF